MTLEEYINNRGNKKAIALSNGEIEALGLPDYDKGWFKRYKNLSFDHQTVLNALVAGANSKSIGRKRLMRMAEDYALKYNLSLDFSYKLPEAKNTLRKLCNVGATFSDRELVILSSNRLNVIIDINEPVSNLIIKLADSASDIVHTPKMITGKSSKAFYKSREWKILRYAAFELYGNSCICCGAKPNDDVVLHVDHIKPRSLYPELELDINNLQILCADCNIGKLNQSTKEW